jgi:elongation factor G
VLAAVAGGVEMTSRDSYVQGILSFAIKLIDDQDRADLQQELSALIQAHPTLRIEVSAFENGLIVRGDDELELMEIREKIAPQYGANIGELMISYRESIRRPADGEGKYIRQTGGAGNYGHCKLRVEPNEPGKGYEFINDLKSGVVPKEYIKPIDQGIQGAMELGILAGFPVVDVKAILFDGSYHEADSNEMAFKFAGSIAFKEAARKAAPVLLEPIMAVKVTAPEEFLGTIIGDINLRRGRIEGMEHMAGTQVIRAAIPLAEMLNSSRYGRPKYSMHFAGYQPAPPRHEQFGDDAGTPVRKPSSPKPKTGSAAAGLDS